MVRSQVPRDTATGAKFEKRVLATLEASGLRALGQVRVGEKPGGGRHVVDCVVTCDDGRELLVSCKTQSSGGTAEEKLPFELMKLAHTVTDDPARWGDYAVLIVDGDGWTPGIKKMLDQDAWVWMDEARRRVRIYYSVEEFMAGEFPIL